MSSKSIWNNVSEWMRLGRSAKSIASQSMWNNVPECLIFSVWHAIASEIYPEIRAIALRLDSDKDLLVRYYFDREPTEEDRENMDYVLGLIDPDVPLEEMKVIRGEAIFSTEKMEDLDTLDCLVYARRE